MIELLYLEELMLTKPVNHLGVLFVFCIYYYFFKANLTFQPKVYDRYVLIDIFNLFFFSLDLFCQCETVYLLM